MKRFGLLKSILLLLAIVFISWSVIPVLLVNGANNLAVKAIMNVWEGISPEEGPPRCKKKLDHIEAEKYYKIAHTINPAKKTTQTIQGRLAWLKGDCTEAKQSWMKTIDSENRDERNALWLFWLENEVSSSLVGKEKLANYVSGMGTIADTSGFSDSAIAWYELSLGLQPTDYVIVHITNLYKQTGQIENAKTQLKGTLDFFVNDQEIYWWMKGQLAELEEDWEDALDAYTKAVKIADDPFDFYIRQAISLEHLGMWAEVEEAYLNAIGVRPDHILGYIGLGNIQRREGNYSDALKWYEKAESLEPGNYSPKFIIGEMYFEQNLFSQAEAYFNKAISINPDHDLSNYYLARIYYNHGDYERAIGTLIKAINFSPYPHGNWLILLGDWQWESGDPRNALVSYRSAKRVYPEDSTIKARIVNLIKIMRHNEQRRGILGMGRDN